MPEKISSTIYPGGNSIPNIEFDHVKTCPICKHAIHPVLLHHIAYTRNGTTYFSMLNFCRSCDLSFIAIYELLKKSPPNQNHYYTSELLYCAPEKYIESEFDEHIRNLSPQFVKIYNQASAAESTGLDEIAGLGYRKSLEFLIKDFAILEYADKADHIKSANLSLCIKTYIDNPHIKTLAEKSAWIGNDEAHYIRKQGDRDISDMKAFIQATVYFISMVLITKDAATMQPK